MTADLLYSDVEDDLRASVRALLADHCEPSALLKRAESGEPYDLELWRALAGDLGAAGLQVPEDRGGHGASAREIALVLEELGRSVAPVPFLGSAVLATNALLATGTDHELLGKLAAGTTTAALAVPLSSTPDTFQSTVEVSGGVLTGRVGTVADASVADVLVVPAGDGLYLVDSGFTVSELVSLDLTRRVADVTLSGAHGTLIASGAAATEALTAALTAGAALLASEQLGLADWCLEETVRYLKGRYQFGRPVGSFQALKHRLADLWLELVSARAAARYAADCLARRDPDLPVAAAVAQALCSDIAVHAAEECVQLHAGIGMTWEHPAHLYLKRAKANQIALGTAGRHRAALATLLDLPG
ncbi:acyl-CoA dehydrogenase family protein [Amycolatopsis magusensis]|uniref:acyl-CoA dehydrogenase family protein n=1 Tax=Amycolatopsis magusensis TaxID=882444 RepID=UPI003C2B278B